ncbi:Hypothetical predicted protein [Octopus vulgaris]|uniref:Uncharacterized protein n=1 Tax=Octopus vulgaris TaxID=6645 RepID=A0AA36F6W3_OCTVU|nr:Hypothetical predicted protein [Octopus vulgaris]
MRSSATQSARTKTENSEEIEHLISKKRVARIAFKNHPKRSNKKCLKQEVQMYQRRLREIQNSWWQAKAVELQGYADQGNMHRFYTGTKKIFSPIRSSTGALKTADGQILTTEEIMHHWKEHFHLLLNNQSQTPEDLLRNTLQRPVKLWMAFPPSFQEFMKTIE